MANFRIYNETLAPELWDVSQHLDSKVRMNLLQMAYDFYGKTNLPAPVLDVYLMGSIANYNWTKDSDVDVHIIIDYSKLQMPVETANKTVKTAGAQWNSEHEVTIKGFKVEMNIQNAFEQKPYVTGIYSLVKDQWIRKPFEMSPQIDRSILKFQYGSMRGYIQNAFNSKDREQMKAAKKYLDAYRQYGLDTYGELSYENLVFKILRARGVIKKLKDGIVAVYDKAMSVDEANYLGIGIVDYWMSPDFKLYRVKSHLSWAIDYLDGKNIKHSSIKGMGMKVAGGESAYDIMYKLGWVRIIISSEVVYYEPLTISQKQMHRVKDIGIENGAKYLSVAQSDKYKNIDEVGEKDVKQTLPSLNVKDNPEVGTLRFDRSYWDKMNVGTGHFMLQRLTMDELKALREKEVRAIAYCQKHESSAQETLHYKMFNRYNNELKRRVRSINAPITESPMMTKKGTTALAGDKPLKNQAVEEVTGNIVVIRQGKGGGFLPEGWTMVYFMDSDESAQSMKQGQIPYLMVPRGTFMSGGSPITDIWLKKFQKPGTHHILGAIEGHSDEQTIFIDMVTVRPGWKRNHIAKLMMDRLKKTFPEAKLTTSTQTDSGQKLFKSYGGEKQKTNEEFSLDSPGAGICWAWMSPDTTIIKVPPENHILFAKKYLGVSNPAPDDYDEIIERMYRKGFIKLVIGDRIYFYHSKLIMPSQKQMAKLKTIAIESQKKLVDDTVHKEIGGFLEDCERPKMCGKQQKMNESHDPGEDAAMDFFERRDQQLTDLSQSLKRSKGRGKVPWKTVPAMLLMKVWLQYGRTKHIDKEGLDIIADQILTNIARLRASTEMMGHTSNNVRPELEDNGIKFTDRQWDEWMSNYFTDNDGSWRLSDYGLPKLEHLYGDIFNAETDEDRLYAIDKALNVIHQRNDLAAMFVEGGSSTLRKIFNQGGYSSPEEKEETRHSWMEGYGSGIPEKDRLKIENTDGSTRRWQVRSKNAPKTPKMTTEIVIAVPKFDKPHKNDKS